MTDIVTMVLSEEVAKQFPSEITVELDGEERMYFLSYRAHMKDLEDPTHIMIEYRDIREEMGDLIRYERKYKE